MSGTETAAPAAERSVEIDNEDLIADQRPVELRPDDDEGGDTEAGSDEAGDTDEAGGTGAAGYADVPDWPAERRALIDLLIYAWDRAKSPGVCERLALGLEQVGVSVLRPDGELFDPARHEVGAVEPTADEGLHDRIAETELAGFSDRGQLIREPIVVVYRPA